MDGVVFDAAFESEDERDFPDELVDPFQQLMVLGHLEDSWEWGGRKFRIRTLTTGEELSAAVVANEFAGIQLAEGRANIAALTALALEEVDDLPFLAQLGPTEKLERSKFKKLLKYHWPIIEMIYRHYLELERKQREVIAALDQTLSDDNDSDQESDSSVE